MEEFDRPVRNKEDGKDRNKAKKRAKYANTWVRESAGHSPGHKTRLLSLQETSDSPDSTELKLNTNHLVTENSLTCDQKANSSQVTVSKMSTSKLQTAAAGLQNTQLSAKIIDFVASPTLSLDQNVGEAEDSGEGAEGYTKNCPQVDDSVRAVVAEIVEKVASQVESSDSRTFDDCHSHRLESNSVEKMEDDVFEDDDSSKMSARRTTDSEDEIKFHVKLSAIKMTNDRMKEKSKICFAALKELKSVCADIGDDNEHLQNIINAFQGEHEKSLSNVSEKKVNRWWK